MPKPKARPTQTKVKHTILQDYLQAWGGIILSGLRGAAARRGSVSSEAHFVYVDCDAYRGRFDGELDDVKAGRPVVTVYGSPLIGIRSLDALIPRAAQFGISLRTNVILFEKKLQDFEILHQTLQNAGFADRIVLDSDFPKLQNGQIALINGDSTTWGAKLIQFTQKSAMTYSFFFLDPYGPRGIPLSFVRRIIEKQHHDVIINMPYRDLHKKTGLLTKANLTPDQAQRLQDYNAMFGHDKWQTLISHIDMDAVWGSIDESAEVDNEDEEIEDVAIPLSLAPVDAVRLASARERELQLMQCYQESLERVDPTLVVKSIGLHYPAVQQTMFYLYLTTHDPTGGLTMNKVLSDANLQEQDLRWKLRTTIDTNRKGYAGTLFDLPAPTTAPIKRTVPKIIADEIVEQLGGSQLLLRQIYRSFTNTLYFDTEIVSALNILRKAGMAQWEGKGKLTNRTVITILRSLSEPT